jgi:ketosteroid isomerase-like protein
MYKLYFAAIFFAACNGADKKNDRTVFDIAAVKAHIIEMNKTYSKRFTTGDSAFYKERYCKDAQVLSPNTPAVIGRDSIIKFFYGDGKNTDAVIELPAGIIYGNEELVVEEGSYNFPDGKGGSYDKGKFIALWKQEDGKWKLYREIWNTDIAPKQ